LRRLAITASVLGLVALTGCGSMKRLEVTVRIPDELKAKPDRIPSIEVNLVGVNSSDLAKWKGSMSDYWSPGNKLRADNKKNMLVFRFSQGEPGPYKLGRKDAMYKRWQEMNATHVLVLADIPGVKESPEDPRRKVLPLHPKAWTADAITITIKAGGISCEPGHRKGW
jgi:hypothetical protein